MLSLQVSGAMETAQEVGIEEPAGTLPSLVDLLQAHSSDTIISWLSAGSGVRLYCLGLLDLLLTGMILVDFVCSEMLTTLCLGIVC